MSKKQSKKNILKSLNDTAITLAGGFSAGKSSFINSFIKSNFILNSDILPCTKSVSLVINSNLESSEKSKDGSVIFTPLKYDICFKDTPGCDDLNAFEVLQNAQKIIWLIGASTTGTIPMNDLDILANLNAKIYIVLNKADLLINEQINAILDEIALQCEYFGLNIVGFSAYSSLLKKEYAFKKISLNEYLKQTQEDYECLKSL